MNDFYIGIKPPAKTDSNLEGLAAREAQSTEQKTGQTSAPMVVDVADLQSDIQRLFDEQVRLDVAGDIVSRERNVASISCLEYAVSQARPDEAPALRAEVADLHATLKHQGEDIRAAWATIDERQGAEGSLRDEVARLKRELADESANRGHAREALDLLTDAFGLGSVTSPDLDLVRRAKRCRQNLVFERDESQAREARVERLKADVATKEAQAREATRLAGELRAEVADLRAALVRVVNEGTDGFAVDRVSTSFLLRVPDECVHVKAQRDDAQMACREVAESLGPTAISGVEDAAGMAALLDEAIAALRQAGGAE